MANFTVIFSDDQSVDYTEGTWTVGEHSGVLTVHQHDGTTAVHSPSAWRTVKHETPGGAAHA